MKFGPLVKGDLMDRAQIDAALAEYRPVAVMHFAALSLVGESMADPGRYWRANVGGALNLIEACAAAGVQNFVFSSTCATYGDQDGVLLTRTRRSARSTPMADRSSQSSKCCAISGQATGWDHVIFRYFNVAGADPEGEIGEQHRPRRI